MEITTPSHILITGFSGFMGGYLIEQCRAKYPDARLFGICKSPPSHPVAFDIHCVTPIIADITHAEQMRHAIAQSQPDCVFHLAAQSSVASSWADPASTLHINTDSTAWYVQRRILSAKNVLSAPLARMASRSLLKISLDTNTTSRIVCLSFVFAYLTPSGLYRARCSSSLISPGRSP